MSLEKAKSLIFQYSENHENDNYFEFYQALIKQPNGNIETRILDEDAAVELTEGEHKDTVVSIELYGISKGVTEYCNFLTGKSSNSDSENAFKSLRSTIEFEANPNPIRAQIRYEAIGNKEIKVTNQDKTVVPKKQFKDNANYRDTSSKAGMQAKADNYFTKKSVTQNLDMMWGRFVDNLILI